MLGKLLFLLVFVGVDFILFPITKTKWLQEANVELFFTLKYTSFFSGILLMLLISLFNFLWLKKLVTWFLVFTHEMTHAFAAIVTFGNIKELNVKESSGHVTHSGSKANNFVTLAPYILPLLPWLFYLVHFVVKNDLQQIFQGFIGFIFGTYLYRAVTDASPIQPDLKNIGYFWFYPIFISSNWFWIQIFFLYF
ncbi:MAG: M50 family metallopeptidase [Sediminibacterium sp.]|nr:M50 family metallopeptidase [Sediminibacterium sp.]